MKAYKCLVLPGDGIGPEVTEQALAVVKRVSDIYSLPIELSFAEIGGEAIDKHGEPCPNETLDLAQDADAILLGAVGGPKWESLPLNERPEKGLLRIRSAFSFFANYRPAKIFPSLADASPLNPALIENIDILILRELISGIYFGEPRGRQGDEAYNTMRYSRAEIAPLVHKAFTAARQRDKKLCSVDKANVLEASVLWREVVEDVASNYPEVELSHLYVDNAAMQLVSRPSSFDVIVTENLFGDILSDLSAQLVGSIGVLPSASLNEAGKGLYEPVHGSAPDIAGEDKANPIACILSAAMMLRYSFSAEDAASAIESAVAAVLDDGFRTFDLVGDTEADSQSDSGSANKVLGCAQMGSQILDRLS